MPRAYSLDLRQRAVDRVAAGESVRSVAAILKVSVSSVVKWSQRYRQTGSAAAGEMCGHRPRVLLPQRDWILARTSNGQPFTLRGLQAELAERGVAADYRTVWSFVHAEGLSFKKKRSAQRAGSSWDRTQAGVLEEVSSPD
jgi:putative transposase